MSICNGFCSLFRLLSLASCSACSCTQLHVGDGGVGDLGVGNDMDLLNVIPLNAAVASFPDDTGPAADHMLRRLFDEK